jgi:hypothetical protein
MDRSVPELKTVAEGASEDGAGLLLSPSPRLGALPCLAAAMILLALALGLVIDAVIPRQSAAPPALLASIEWRQAAAPMEAIERAELSRPIDDAPDIILAAAARPDFTPSPAPADAPLSNPAPRGTGDAEGGSVSAADPAPPRAGRASAPQQASTAAAKPVKPAPPGVLANAAPAKRGTKTVAGTGRSTSEIASGQGACRSYTSNQTMEGGVAPVTGTVCRSADGSWRLVSQYSSKD